MKKFAEGGATSQPTSAVDDFDLPGITSKAGKPDAKQTFDEALAAARSRGAKSFGFDGSWHSTEDKKPSVAAKPAPKAAPKALAKKTDPALDIGDYPWLGGIGKAGQKVTDPGKNGPIMYGPDANRNPAPKVADKPKPKVVDKPKPKVVDKPKEKRGVSNTGFKVPTGATRGNTAAQQVSAPPSKPKDKPKDKPKETGGFWDTIKGIYRKADKGIEEGQKGMKKGGGVKKYAKGGGIEKRGKTKTQRFAKGGAIDGCAKRGHTKARGYLMRPIVVTLNGLGTSQPLPLDIHGWPSISLQVDLTGAGPWGIEQTLDDPFSTPLNSIVWIPHPDPNMVNQTGDRQGNYAYLPAALRIVQGGSGVVRLTVIQAGGARGA